MYKICIFLLLCGMALHAQTLQRTKILMGTFATVSLDEKDKEHFVKIFDILKDVDNSLSSFNLNSPIYKLNHNKVTKIDDCLYRALLLSQEYYKKSDGYFDIAVGAITKDLYKFGLQERVPSHDELQSVHINFKKLKFNEQKASLNGDIKIDLGGMGKGFGVDAVAKYMREHSLKNAKVALSGDIRCLSSCKIEVKNPYKNEPLAIFETKESDMGVTTSGNYNRFAQTREHNHLINPKTKLSETLFVSITLVSKLPSSDLDAYATAASVMPRKNAYEFLDALALAYIVLQRDKKLIVSTKIEKYVKNLVVKNTLQE